MTAMTLWMYVLDDQGQPRPEPDVETWGRWMQTADRTVAKTTVGTAGEDKGIDVSTVFLGLDHGVSTSDRVPVLWETMVFGGVLDGEQVRYTSKEDAVQGHWAMVERVRGTVLGSGDGDGEG